MSYTSQTRGSVTAGMRRATGDLFELVGEPPDPAISNPGVVRRCSLSLPDLYDSHGIYGRWNPPGLLALVAGVGVALAGLVIPAVRVLYDYAWFVGFAVAFVAYWALMRRRPALGPDEPRP